MIRNGWFPTAPDLEDAPELAILVALDLALEMAEHAILAQFPRITRDNPPAEPSARAAAAIRTSAWHLRRLISRYKSARAEDLHAGDDDAGNP